MLWLLYIAGGLVVAILLLVALLALLGSRIPESHTASVSQRFAKCAPEHVWAVIADPLTYPEWAAGVTKVEKLADREGHDAYRQTMGRNSFILETTRSDPPRLLERTIADDHAMFSGSWTYQVTPDGPGCIVTITERGRVTRAVPRAIMKHLMGYHLYLAKHLRSLAGKLGESGPTIEKTMG